MSIIEIYKLTDAYLAGDLSAEEVQAFELRCQNDAVFGQEVRLYIASLGEIRAAGEKMLKGQLKERFSEGKLISMRTERPAKPWLWVAAAAATLLLVSLWWLLSPRQSKLPPQDLYAEYMEAPYVSVTRAPALDSLAPGWMEALGFLHDSLFQEAIPLLDTLLQDSSFFARYGGQGVVYLGTALMHERNFEAALEQFGRVENGNPYMDQVIWYKALCHMKLNQVSEATQLLTEIGENKFHFKRSKALEILKYYPPK